MGSTSVRFKMSLCASALSPVQQPQAYMQLCEQVQINLAALPHKTEKQKPEEVLYLHVNIISHL